MYTADEKNPWKYVWIEFDGMRAEECLLQAGLEQDQPIYRPRSIEEGDLLRDRMLYFYTKRAPCCKLSSVLNIYHDFTKVTFLYKNIIFYAYLNFLCSPVHLVLLEHPISCQRKQHCRGSIYKQIHRQTAKNFSKE